MTSDILTCGITVVFSCVIELAESSGVGAGQDWAVYHVMRLDSVSYFRWLNSQIVLGNIRISCGSALTNLNMRL